MRAGWARANAANLAVYALGAGTAYGLKAFSSGAGAGDLGWVLAPTCWLAAHLGGIDLVPESGAGYISHGRHLVVGPACAGLNFLVIAFAALFFSLAHHQRGARRRAGWLLASLALAYVATVLTNTVRVVLAARLYELDLYGSLVTPARLHRLMGTVLYVASLLGLYTVAERLVDGGAPAQRSPWRRLVPLGFYLAVALVVPLRRAPFGGVDRRLLEHAAVVLAGLVVVVLVGGLTTAIVRALGDRLESARRQERGMNAP
jgi:exosortase K